MNTQTVFINKTEITLQTTPLSPTKQSLQLKYNDKRLELQFSVLFGFFVAFRSMMVQLVDLEASTRHTIRWVCEVSSGNM